MSAGSKLRALERRRNYLITKLPELDGYYADRAAQEAAALNWAISELTKREISAAHLAGRAAERTEAVDEVES